MKLVFLFNSLTLGSQPPSKSAHSQYSKPGASTFKDVENLKSVDTLPAFFLNSDYAKIHLGHLIASQKMLARARESERPRAKRNPYEEDLEKLLRRI